MGVPATIAELGVVGATAAIEEYRRWRDQSTAAINDVGKAHAAQTTAAQQYADRAQKALGAAGDAYGEHAAAAEQGADRVAAANDNAGASADKLSSQIAALQASMADNGAKTAAALKQIADNTDSSFGSLASKAAISAAVWTATRGVIIDGAEAIKSGVSGAASATGRAIGDITSAIGTVTAAFAAWVHSITDGNLDAHLTGPLRVAAIAMQDTARLGQVNASTLQLLADQAKATGVPVDTLTGMFTHLVGVIEGTDQASKSARASAQAMGVSLDGVARTDAPLALDQILQRLNQLQDSALKTALIEQLLGTANKESLKAIAENTGTIDAASKAHAGLVAQLDALISEHRKQEDALAKEPGVWGTIAGAIMDAITPTRQFKDEMALLAEQSEHAKNVSPTGGLLSLDYWSSLMDRANLFLAQVTPFLTGGEHVTTEAVGGAKATPDMRNPAPDPALIDAQSKAANLRTTIEQSNQALVNSQEQLDAIAARQAAINALVGAKVDKEKISVGNWEQLVALIGQAQAELKDATAVKAFIDLIDATNKEIEALKGGEKAYTAYQARQQAIADLTSRQIPITDANIAIRVRELNTVQKLKDGIDAEKTARDAAKKSYEDGVALMQANIDAEVKASETIDKQIESLQQQIELEGLSDRARAIRIQEIQAETTAKAGGYVVDETKIDQLKREAAALFDLQKAKKDQQQAEQQAQAASRAAAQQLAREIDHTTNQVVDEGARLIDTLWGNDKKDRVKAFWDETVKIAEHAFDEMAAQALLRPLIQPVIQEIAGSGLLGLVNNQANGTAGAGGVSLMPNGSGGFDVVQTGNQLAGLVNNGKSLFSSGGSAFGGVSDFLVGSPAPGMEIGDWAGGTFGASNGVIGSGGNLFGVGANAFGTAGEGSAATGLTLGGAGTVLGGLGGVYGGISGLANAGNYNTIGNIANAGQLIGGGVAVAGGLGSMFGGALGGMAALGPYGLIAAAIFAVVSQLFGAKKPHNLSGVVANPLTDAGLINPVGGEIGADNVGKETTDYLASVLSKGVEPFTSQFASQYGIHTGGNTAVGVASHQTEGQDDYKLSLFTEGSLGHQSFDVDRKNQQSLIDAYTKVGLVELKQAERVDNLDLAYARQNITLDETTQQIQGDIAFASGLGDALENMRKGGGFDLSKTLEGAAKQGADTLMQQFSAFDQQVSHLFAGGPQVQAAADAEKAYVETLIGIRPVVEQTYTAQEAAVVSLKAQFAAMDEVFKKTGIDVTEQTAAMTVQLKRLADAEKADLTAQYRKTFNQGYLDDLETSGAALTTNLRNIAASMPDVAQQTDSVNKALAIFGKNVTNVLGGLSESDLDAVIDNYANATDAAGKFIEAAATNYLAVIKGTGKTYDEVGKAADDASSSVADLAAQLRGAGANIQAYLDRLQASDAGGLPVPDQYALARQQFDRELALAQANNLDALGAITDYADRLINLGLSDHATGADQQALIAYVEQSLANLPAVKSANEQIIDLLGDIRAGTGTVAGNVTGVGGKVDTGNGTLGTISTQTAQLYALGGQLGAISGGISALGAELLVLHGDLLGMPHAGGGTAGGLSIINDAGPEIVRLPGGSHVMTFAATLSLAQRLAGSIGGGDQSSVVGAIMMLAGKIDVLIDVVRELAGGRSLGDVESAVAGVGRALRGDMRLGKRR